MADAPPASPRVPFACTYHFSSVTGAAATMRTRRARPSKFTRAFRDRAAPAHRVDVRVLSCTRLYRQVKYPLTLQIARSRNGPITPPSSPRAIAMKRSGGTPSRRPKADLRVRDFANETSRSDLVLSSLAQGPAACPTWRGHFEVRRCHAGCAAHLPHELVSQHDELAGDDSSSAIGRYPPASRLYGRSGVASQIHTHGHLRSPTRC